MLSVNISPCLKIVLYSSIRSEWIIMTCNIKCVTGQKHFMLAAMSSMDEQSQSQRMR